MTDDSDIRPGDQVVLPEDIWTVRTVRTGVGAIPPLTIDRFDEDGHYHKRNTFPEKLQRVELGQ